MQSTSTRQYLKQSHAAETTTKQQQGNREIDNSKELDEAW
jgi:hypothetical protein